MKLFLIVSAVIFLSVGCASKKKSVTLGVTTGALTGALAGNYLAEKNRRRATLEGALVSGAIGGLAAYFIHKALETRR